MNFQIWRCHSMCSLHPHSTVDIQPFSPVFPLADFMAEAFCWLFPWNFKEKSINHFPWHSLKFKTRSPRHWTAQIHCTYAFAATACFPQPEEHFQRENALGPVHTKNKPNIYKLLYSISSNAECFYQPASVIGKTRYSVNTPWKPALTNSLYFCITSQNKSQYVASSPKTP